MGSLVYTCRRFSKSVPLKRMASSKNIFVWFCGGLNLPAGPDTPQNKILLGIRPHRTRPCGVSEPRRTRPCGVSDLAEQWQICVHFIACTCSAGSDTPQSNVLRGLIPRLTKSCGVSDPAEQSPVGYQTPRNNIQKRIFLRIRKRIQKYFRV